MTGIEAMTIAGIAADPYGSKIELMRRESEDQSNLTPTGPISTGSLPGQTPWPE
jgi:hypothetical protein